MNFVRTFPTNRYKYALQEWLFLENKSRWVLSVFQQIYYNEFLEYATIRFYIYISVSGIQTMWSANAQMFIVKVRL